jgi:hypothetical protein
MTRDFPPDSGRRAIGHDPSGEIRHHDGTSANHRVGSNANAVPNDSPDPHEGHATNMDAARQMGSRAYVYAILDTAIVIHTGTCVDDDVVAENCAGTDHGAGRHDCPGTDRYVSGDSGAGMYCGGEIEAVRAGQLGQTQACRTIADCHQEMGDAGRRHVDEQISPAQDGSVAEWGPVPFGGVVEEPGYLVLVHETDDVGHDTSMPRSSPYHQPGSQAVSSQPVVISGVVH